MQPLWFLPTVYPIVSTLANPEEFSRNLVGVDFKK